MLSSFDIGFWKAAFFGKGFLFSREYRLLGTFYGLIGCLWRSYLPFLKNGEKKRRYCGR